MKREILSRGFWLFIAFILNIPLSYGADSFAYVVGRNQGYSKTYNDEVWVINTSKDEVVGNIDLGGPSLAGPIGVTANGNTIYVGSKLEDLSVIDSSSNKLVGDPITAKDGFSSIAVSPDGKKVYGIGRDSFFIINTSVKAEIPSSFNIEDQDVENMALTPDGSKLYFTSWGKSVNIDGRLSVMNTANEKVTVLPIEMGLLPGPISITSDGKKAYIINSTEDYEHGVSVLNTSTNQLIAYIPIEDASGPIAITPDGKKVYVLCTYGSSSLISVINMSTQKITTIPIVNDNHSIAVTPDGKKVYLVNSNSHTISVIDTSNDKMKTAPILLDSGSLVDIGMARVTAENSAAQNNGGESHGGCSISEFHSNNFKMDSLFFLMSALFLLLRREKAKNNALKE